MAERIVGTNTRKRLINNEPFAYAHLVKFERPSSTLKDGNFSTDAKRYAYFTDATHNVSFDDQSTNTAGSNNGSQTYIAGKLLNVGNYSETIEARASGMTVTLAAESLNNAITSTAITMTSSTITIPAGIDAIREGFREGDKIYISGGTNNGKYVNITGIKTNGTVFNVTNIDHTLATQNTGTSITLSIVSDELQGPLGETNLSTVKSYANRDVWVYKAFLDPETGAVLDSTPVLIFKGIITKADIVDSPGNSVRAKWSLTSHWGDFAQVKGRPTNDAVHRALNAQGRGQPLSALRPEYANDLGFLHAEETLNILATYTTIEQETKYKMKKKWYGKVKMKEVVTDVEVENDVDLSFSLASKYLPVVYGVQRISGIPFFVDTKQNDANNIFLAYALCEGEIGGIYDLYMEGNPLMCINKEDADDRDAASGDQLAQIEVHCRGRADKGDTLGGVKISGNGVSGSNASDYDYGDSYVGYGTWGYDYERDYIEAQIARYHSTNTALKSTTVSTTNGTGVKHEETISLTAPNTMSLTLHTGKIDQLADNTLIEISQASAGSKFKRQADYYTGDEDYWGPNHRVLDTAYVVMDVEIGEDATTVPEVEYVVRGKLCSSYNYDYSYAHKPGASSEAHTNFKVGDKVDLFRFVNGGSDVKINDDVLIIDKWSFSDPDGNIQYRFRFSTAPTLGYSNGYATYKDFYMSNSSQTWSMVTWDWTDTIHNSGAVADKLEETVTINNNGDSPPTITIPEVVDWIDSVAGDREFSDYHGFKVPNGLIPYGYLTLWFKQISDTVMQLAGTGGSSNAITAGSQTIISANTIKLASGASTTDDYYNDFDIELTRTTTAEDGSTQTASWTRTISDYDGGTKIATVSTPWVATYEPDDTKSDTYKLLSKIKDGRTDDKRVSINPTIQLLDYLTGRYGKALSLETDISLADFVLAARTCDDRGTQTLQGADIGSSNVGKRYVLTSDGTTSGTVVAMGLVKSRGTSNSVGFTEFEEVYGKFTKKFMKNSYSYLVGDIVYTNSGYYRAGTTGVEAKEPAGTSNISAGSNGYTLSWTYLTSVPLFAITNTGSISGSAIAFTRVANGKYGNPCAVYNSSTLGYDTGYSLYDSDDVKYWRYYGWDDKHQRFATRHQTQGTVSTADSVFSNVNGFLANFNGLLSYEGGRYALRIETTSDAINSTKITATNTSSYSGYTKGVQYNPRVIDNDDIIGNLSVQDKGTSKSYNTVSASILDPANLFKGRAVTFYDSSYLRADKNVVKSGNINIASVANYYNARINVENFLRKSRFGLSISFKTGPKSLLLLAGDTIAITNDKFGFTEKKFRIQNINYAKDCTATITASEYDDSFYSISAPALPSVVSQDQRQGLQSGPGAPSNLSATANALGGIDLAWTNATGLTAANCWTEIYSSPNSSTSNRTLLAKESIPGKTFAHSLGSTSIQRYYWIRHAKQVTLTSGSQNKIKELYSAYVGSANATTAAPISAYGVTIGGPTSFVVDSDGASVPTEIIINASRTNLSGNITWTAVEEDGGSITLTNTSNTVATLTYSNFGASNKYVTITASVTSTSGERAAGADNTYTDTWVISKVTAGSIGADGSSAKTVHLTVDDYSIVYDVDGANPSPSGNMTLTATAQGFTNGFFKFTGDGISDEGSYTDGSGANADTFTFTVPSSHFTTPKTLRVGVAEANQTETAFDTISIFAVKPGATGADGLDGLSFVNTNASHTLPASSAGVVSSYANSGTTFEVYEGGTELVYDGTGTSNSRWKVVVTTATNISAGGFTDNGNSVTVGSHSGVADGTDVSKIIYTISGKRAGGTTFSTTQEQTFTKAKAGGQGNSVTGATGPRTTRTRLNHSASAGSAPTAPTASNTNTFDFSDGNFDNILSGWSHSTPTYASGNSNKYWYIDVTIVEGSFNGSQTLTFGSVTQAIGFSGLVTFSDANTITDGTNTKVPIIASQVNSNVTSISGSVIQTGTILANRLALSGSGAITIGSFTNDSGFTNDDAADAAQSTANGKTTASAAASAANSAAKTDGSVGGLTLTSSKMHIGTGTVNNSNTAFYVDSSGNFSLKDKLYWNGNSLSINGDITITNPGDIDISDINNDSGFTDDTTADSKTTAAAAASAANSAAKTDGSVGGLTLTSDKMYIGAGTINNANTAFYVDNTGKMSLKDKLHWNGSTLSINGDITIGNASDVRSDLNVADGATDDTTANSKTTAAAAASAANSADKEGGKVAGWIISASKMSNSKIEIDNANERILIKDS